MLSSSSVDFFYQNGRPKILFDFSNGMQASTKQFVMGLRLIGVDIILYYAYLFLGVFKYYMSTFS